MIKSRLIIYDTSNFIDFPIGGQLTSIRNFLRFLTECHPERMPEVVLAGVTTRPEEVGRVTTVGIFGGEAAFLPVAAVCTELAWTGQSLRLAYARGLLKYGKSLKISRYDCNYIHTPEAYGVVKLCNPLAKCIIFSHGSYFNMERGFRFFQNNPLIKKGFMLYIRIILRNARLLLVIDEDSRKAYERLNRNVVKAGNSIVCGEQNKKLDETGAPILTNQVIFVGRLSKDKGVREIMRATALLAGRVSLLIVGDGEERHALMQESREGITFAGAVAPEAVAGYMEKADMLIMNSAFEGIPMTILEAVSIGLPVVTTDVGGIGEVLRFGVDSEKTAGTAESIAAAVEKVYQRYGQYSAHAYERSKEYDYLQINAKIYERIGVFWTAQPKEEDKLER